MKILKSYTGGSIFEFLKTIPRTLYPHSYLELRHRTLKDALKYFLSIIFVAYFIMFVIAVPKLIHLSNYIDTQFGKFKKLNLQLDIELSEPVVFTDKDPQVVITQENSTNITYNKFLITANTIYFKESFSKTKEINYRDYLNILAKKDSIRKIMVTLFYVMIPTTLFLMYLLSIVKYIIILSIATIFSYLMTRMIKYEVTIRQAFTSALYASTIMVIIEVISFPLQITNYLLPIPIYAGISIALVPLAGFLTIYIIALVLISGKFVVLGSS